MSTAPKTIGDVIQAKRQAAADVASTEQAAKAADAAYAAALQADKDADQVLKQDLEVLGPVYIEDGGVIKVYLPDASDNGYHVIQPTSAATVVPGEPEDPEEPDQPTQPTPTATPTPEPEPTPTPEPGPSPAPEVEPTPDHLG